MLSGSFTLFCIIKGATPEFGVSVKYFDNHRFPKKQSKAEFPARKKTHSFTKTLRHIAVVVEIPLIYPLTVLAQWNKFKLQLPKDINRESGYKDSPMFPLFAFVFMFLFFLPSFFLETNRGRKLRDSKLPPVSFPRLPSSVNVYDSRSSLKS